MIELKILEAAISEIADLARAHGLDFFPMRFEICPADVIYAFSAYGMPGRFSHWSFGKAYYRIKKQYDYGLNRICEMVINTDPCYAFLLESNSPLQNKLVIAHTLAHSDFFKNNAYFGQTARDMVEMMALAADRIRGYEALYGRDQVEQFLDAVLAIQEHVDPHPFSRKRSAAGDKPHGPCTPDESIRRDRESAAGTALEGCEPEKDLLWFIAEHAPELADWERDIVQIVHREALYFWPQLTTKFLNEGWATYWHTRLLRKLDLDDSEVIEFARVQAELLQPGKLCPNPYLTGLRILESVERRYGREKLFEVRAEENDVSFIRSYLTEDLVKELDIYVYRLVGQDWRVAVKEWEKVREALLINLINGGHPYIVVADGNYSRRGELYLRHIFEKLELDVHHLERAAGGIPLF